MCSLVRDTGHASWFWAIFVETTVSGLRLVEPNYGSGTLGFRAMPVYILGGSLMGIGMGTRDLPD